MNRLKIASFDSLLMGFTLALFERAFAALSGEILISCFQLLVVMLFGTCVFLLNPRH